MYVDFRISAGYLTSDYLRLFFHSLAAFDCSGRCNKTRLPLFWFWNNKWMSKLTGYCTPESCVTRWICFCPSMGSWHYFCCYAPNVRPWLSYFLRAKSKDGERRWRFHGKLNFDNTISFLVGMTVVGVGLTHAIRFIVSCFGQNLHRCSANIPSNREMFSCAWLFIWTDFSSIYMILSSVPLKII